MKKGFRNIFEHSGVLAVIAIALSVGIMAVIFLVFENAFDSPEPEPELVATNEEVFPIYINGIPAPFVSPEDGTLGYVFLDVTLEVVGEEARQFANSNLENFKIKFTEAIAIEGFGKPGAPGVVDYDRLARVFQELAQAEVGQAKVAGVVIQEAEEG